MARGYWFPICPCENLQKFLKVCSELFAGGNIWESNPSGTGLAPHTGFEDQEAHRHLSAPEVSIPKFMRLVKAVLLQS